MSKRITLNIDKETLEDHVKRICRGNLKKTAKLCTDCPILGPVIDIMEDHLWSYNGHELFYEPCASTQKLFSKNRLKIRASEDTDLEGIIKIKKIIFDELVPRLTIWYKKHPEAFGDEFHGQYGQESDKRVFYTVKDCWGVVGCGGLLQKKPGESKIGEISDIYLLAEYRGKGLGKTLVKDLIFKARLLGFEKLFLTTRKEFKAATGLYKRLGFKQVKNTKYKSNNSTAWELKLQ